MCVLVFAILLRNFFFINPIIENYVIIDRDVAPVIKKIEKEEFSPIQLSVFAHRFMAIAEQMGRALQKTSVSSDVLLYQPLSVTYFF